ncbi:GNAT family N-acetyltransferase [Kytococcus sp. Marseille-QA3725]
MHGGRHGGRQSDPGAHGLEVRGIHAHEWRRVWDVRLRALQDPAAEGAFFQRHDEALALSPEDWQEAARVHGPDPAEPEARQFVATDGTEWVATLTVRLQRAGEPEFGGGEIDGDRGMLLGVWIDPDHRGRGLLGRLVGAAADWTAAQGVPRLDLWVHEDNLRAQRAYARLGFEPTGQRVVEAIGPEIAMRREVGGAAGVAPRGAGRSLGSYCPGSA